MSKLEIRLRAYEAPALDQAALKIIETASALNLKISGPIPLPTKREMFTILKSVHVNKKAREQFEIKTHKRLIVLDDLDKQALDGFKRLTVPSSVEIKLQIK